RVPLSHQIYSRIKSETIDNSYDVTAQLAMGRFGERVFINIDGSLDQLRIPGLYTTQGYRNLFQQHSVRIIKEAIEQDWVLNRTQAGSASVREVRTIQMEIQELYIKDYIAYWDGFLNKIKIRDTLNVEDTTELIGYLSGKDSPLKKLLVEVKKNTAPAETGDMVLGAAGEIAERSNRFRVGSKTKDALSALKQKAGDKYDVSIEEVDRHFEKLNLLVHQEEGQASELDSFLSRLSRVYSSLVELQNKSIFSGGSSIDKRDGKLENELQLIEYEAAKLELTTQDWIKTVVNKASGEVASNVQKELNQEWKNNVYAQCKNTLEGRYPLNKGSRREVNLADFTHFFTQQGVMDGFFSRYLKGNIDTAQAKWRVMDGVGESLSISTRSVRNFQYAASIRDKFFKYQSNMPSIKFSLKPITKSEDITKVTLEIDGQKMVFDDTPIRAAGFNWPNGNVGHVRVSFEYQDGSTKDVYQSDGSWALFRFLDIAVNGKIRNSTERISLNISAGASGAKFELYTGGGVNPFSTGELRSFRCPKQL
ncbi:MAG: type VI secretion system membrane subunit TssM, partial [Methyloprofundus sp.]|nr:type VI secretion system membrane subunit TssM [Methyloprofundus sp.]